MEETLSRCLMKISVFSILLPTAVAIFRWKTDNKVQRILGILILISFVIEILALIIGQGLHLNNLPIFHVFTIIEFAILSLIYQSALGEYLSKKITIKIIIVFAAFAIWNSFFWDGIYNFNATVRAIESIGLILLALGYFYHTLKMLIIKNLEKNPLFWLSSGLLIYFSTSLFVNIYSNYFMDSPYLSFTIWGIHAFLNIVLNFFYFLALWVKPNI